MVIVIARLVPPHASSAGWSGPVTSVLGVPNRKLPSGDATLSSPARRVGSARGHASSTSPSPCAVLKAEKVNRKMDTDPGEPVTSVELEKLRQNWEELSSRVAEIEAAALASDTLPTLDFSDGKLAAIASSIHDARKRRLNLFDASLFGEPAWDMLLTLFIARCRGEQVTTTRLCAAGGAPHATGLRWIGLLNSQGLLQRLRAPEDARVMLIELTETGYALMRRYVIDGIAQFQMPLPD